MNSIKNITVIGTGNVALELCKLFLLNNFTVDAILGRKPFSDASLSSDLFTSNYKNIPSNSKVMGYPAKNIRNFLKESKLND